MELLSSILSIFGGKEAGKYQGAAESETGMQTGAAPNNKDGGSDSNGLLGNLIHTIGSLFN